MEVAANVHEDDTITPDDGKLIVGQAMLILQQNLLQDYPLSIVA